jgi:hypothetical protein
MQPQDIAEEVCREYEQMSGMRMNWESHWQEIAERILPMHSRAFQKGDTTVGDKRNQHVYDSTGAIGLNRFAAILDSLLTPRNQTWHRLSVDNLKLASDRQVKLYFEEANKVLFKYRYSPKANFASQNQQNYKGLGAYGTCALYVDELAGEPGIRYKDIHLGEIHLAENHQGIIDKAVRYFPLSARQAMKWFGEALPDKIKDAVKVNQHQLFYFLHCVKPREDRDPERVDYKGMNFASYYVAIVG